MDVLELWRYPVKSLQGERLDVATVTVGGLEGDRAYAIFDTATGFGLTARRVPELLYASARLPASGGVEITLPDGTVVAAASDGDRGGGDSGRGGAGDAALSAWLDRPVELRSSVVGGARRYENPIDFETESASPWLPFDGAAGAFHDSART